TNNRTICFSPDCYRTEICSHGRTRTGTRTTWITVQHVRISGLPAASTPTTRRFTRTKVGPLAEVCLAENDCARFTEFSRHERITLRLRTNQRERSGGGHHAILSVDVVFDQDRNSM